MQNAKCKMQNYCVGVADGLNLRADVGIGPYGANGGAVRRANVGIGPSGANGGAVGNGFIRSVKVGAVRRNA